MRGYSTGILGVTILVLPDLLSLVLRRQGGGGSFSGKGSHGGRGGGERGGTVGRPKKKQWVQALVDQCTDVTETSYPTHAYGGFNKNQRQQV